MKIWSPQTTNSDVADAVSKDGRTYLFFALFVGVRVAHW